MVSPFYAGRIPDYLKCPECHGEGFVSDIWGQKKMLCLTCRGEGVQDGNEFELAFSQYTVKKCLECDGCGYVRCNYDHDHECPECGGDGGELQYQGKHIFPRRLSREMRRVYEEYMETFREKNRR